MTQTRELRRHSGDQTLTFHQERRNGDHSATVAQIPLNVEGYARYIRS